MTIPSGFAQLSHVFQGTALPFRSIITMGVDHSGSTDTPDEMAEAAHGVLETTIMTVLSNTVALLSTDIKLGPDATGLTGTYTEVVAGSIADSACPPNTCLLGTKRAAVGGRKNRGRFFVPGVGETSVSADGGLVGDLITDWPQACTDYYTNLGLNDLDPVILHSDSTSPTAMTSLEGELTVATQRRRLRK